jgi:hypothetical protein
MSTSKGPPLDEAIGLLIDLLLDPIDPAPKIAALESEAHTMLLLLALLTELTSGSVKALSRALDEPYVDSLARVVALVRETIDPLSLRRT